MPTAYACPYFSWEDNKSVNCEGGKLKFETREDRDRYISQYCAACPGWKNCTIAMSLNEKYEGGRSF